MTGKEDKERFRIVILEREEIIKAR